MEINMNIKKTDERKITKNIFSDQSKNKDNNNSFHLKNNIYLKIYILVAIKQCILFTILYFILLQGATNIINVL